MHKVPAHPQVQVLVSRLAEFQKSQDDPRIHLAKFQATHFSPNHRGSDQSVSVTQREYQYTGCFYPFGVGMSQVNLNPEQLVKNRHIYCICLWHKAVQSSLIAPFEMGGHILCPGGAAGCFGSRAAVERWVNNSGTHSATAQPPQPAKLEKTRNKRRAENEFPQRTI